MILDVPVLLIVLYAVYRLVEYGAIKRLGMSPVEAPIIGRLWLPPILGLLLLAARVFGWVFLIYFAYRVGVLQAATLMAIAFPLSLLLQLAPQWLFKIDFGILVSVLSIASIIVLPICAAAMLLLVP